MSVITHPVSGAVIGDPYAKPLAKRPEPAQARRFFDSLILSASGWRGVFGTDDEDLGNEINPSAAYAAARMAKVFAEYLKETVPGGKASPARKPVLALGIDTRPTGPVLADVMARTFLALGIDVRYASVVAAPEIMAWTKKAGVLPEDDPDRMDAFCYISASHNPPGHNGVKFGLCDGGVLPPETAKLLIERLKKNACEPQDIASTADTVGTVGHSAMGAVFSATPANKRRAFSSYLLFTRQICAGLPPEFADDLGREESVLDLLGQSVRAREIGIIADMNGSARCRSIDEIFLGGLGADIQLINSVPGKFAHRIVPEGSSLDQCRKSVQTAHEHDPRYCLGYVPDCDGDRGNIVIWDELAGSARALEAQETFALAVLAELACAEHQRLKNGPAETDPEWKIAVVGNDATSLRIDHIASAFGAIMVRAETGEANVVALARSLRSEGYTVRILGEGSNGGVITHPASVRDPVNTICSLLKIMATQGDETIASPFGLWLAKSGHALDSSDKFSITDIVASLPPFSTTSVFEDRAALRVKSTDHAKLKNASIALFAQRWPTIKALLAETIPGDLEYKVIASRGMKEIELAPGDDADAGGLKFLIVKNNKPVAFLWMRGSGTEPVFRIMADVRGADPATETRLLEMLSDIVKTADAG